MDKTQTYQGADNLILAHVVYGLLVLGIFSGLVASILGIFIAYKARDEADTLSNNHHTYQIRTFWTAVLWAIGLSAILTIFGIMTLGLGFGIMAVAYLLFSIWYAYRVITGWIELTNGRIAPVIN